MFLLGTWRTKNLVLDVNVLRELVVYAVGCIRYAISIVLANQYVEDVLHCFIIENPSKRFFELLNPQNLPDTQINRF